MSARPLVPWLLPILLIVAWQGAASAGWIASRVLPAPLNVAAVAWKLIQTGELWHDILVSTGRAALGFAVGGGIGFALGILNGSSALAARLLDSSLQMLRNIPHLALIPLVILWFGIDESDKLFLVALGVDSFILSGYPHLEEAYRVAELLFPLLPVRRPESLTSSPSLSGPFGELIANEVAPVRAWSATS